MELRNKETIRILVKLARFFGICPSEKPTRFSTFYQLFMLCITFCFSVFSIYCTASESYSNLSTMQIFIDLLTSTFITVEGMSIQIISLLYPTVWRRLLKEFNLTNGTKKHTASICFEIFFLHSLFVARIIWNTIVWTKVVGWMLYRHYIFRLIHEYYALMTHDGAYKSCFKKTILCYE